MTFLEAWENISSIKEQENDAAIDVIFTGLNVADDFWDNFILVCNNKDGLAALLGVSPDKVVSWPPIIQEHLNKAKAKDDPEAKEKTHIIDTGNQKEV